MSKDVVSEMIETWLSEKPNRTLAVLARLSNIGESTLRRAQIGSAKPALHTIVDIGRATGKAELMLKAVEENYPTCLDVLKKGKMAVGAPIEADTSEFFESGISTKIVLSLFAKKGLTRSHVSEVYGSTGIQIVDKILAAGIANELTPGVISPIEAWYSYKSPQEVLKVMRTLNLDFDLEQLGSTTARMSVLSEAVSANDAAKIQSILDQAIILIRTVMDERSGTGEHVVAVSMLMQALK